MFKFISLAVLSLACVQAFAVLDTAASRGVAVKTFEVAGGRPEICVIPQHIPGVVYAKKDSAKESELCALEIGKTAATCPKTNSTNPGVNFFTSETLTIQQIEDSKCESADAKKVAKYKLSSSCSYTPAILSYYHISRALGNVAGVLPSVIRTMNVDRHLEYAELAFDWLKKSGASDELIWATWSGLNSALKAGKGGKNADKLFTDGYDQSYGALSRNPRGESKYDEFFNGGGPDEGRTKNFKAKNPIYKALIAKDLKPGREVTQANVQLMRQMIDAADMILLDWMLSQQDRFGNIAQEPKFYYATVKKDGSFNLKSEDSLKDIPEAFRASAMEVKEMVLKDNDCGVSKTNHSQTVKLLEPVAHMNPKTYAGLQKLAAFIATSEGRDYFTRELLYTDSDIKKIFPNIEKAASMLKKRCQDGDLKLDLDLDLHFSSAELPTTYDCGN